MQPEQQRVAGSNEARKAQDDIAAVEPIVDDVVDTFWCSCASLHNSCFQVTQFLVELLRVVF